MLGIKAISLWLLSCVHVLLLRGSQKHGRHVAPMRQVTDPGPQSLWAKFRSDPTGDRVRQEVQGQGKAAVSRPGLSHSNWSCFRPVAPPGQSHPIHLPCCGGHPTRAASGGLGAGGSPGLVSPFSQHFPWQRVLPSQRTPHQPAATRAPAASTYSDCGPRTGSSAALRWGTGNAAVTSRRGAGGGHAGQGGQAWAGGVKGESG